MRTDATGDYYFVAHMRPEVGHQGKPCDLLGVTRPLAITGKWRKQKSTHLGVLNIMLTILDSSLSRLFGFVVANLAVYMIHFVGQVG